MRPTAARWCAAIATAALVLGGAPTAGAQEELARSLARLSPLIGEPDRYPRKGHEDIYAIARRFGVSASAVYNANGGELSEGDELLLIPGQHIAPVSRFDGIVVNLTERNLYCYEGGRPNRVFPVAIGMRGWETPTGEFTIANKAKNPTWFPPSWALEEEPVPAGPENPLGDRWMGLSKKGYGIHATNAPWTVGRYLSHGCMRMYPEHARELYDLTRVDTPVLIVYRRVVFGFRQEEGAVYMAHYPDPYLIGDVSVRDVREALAQYDLAEIADMRAVGRAINRPSGVPVRIAGSPTKVSVNGRLLELALGPTRVADDWLVPAGPFVAALRATMELGPKANYIAITRGTDRIFYSPSNADAIVNGELVRLAAAPRLAGNYPMIPLRSTATLLGGSVGWDEVRRRILVWDRWGMGTFPQAGAR